MRCLRSARLLADRDLAEDEALGFAFMRGARLGLGLWFAAEARRKSAGRHGAEDTAATTSAVSAVERGAHELWEIHSLLGLYFLATYREEGPDDDA